MGMGGAVMCIGVLLIFISNAPPHVMGVPNEKKAAPRRGPLLAGRRVALKRRVDFGRRGRASLRRALPGTASGIARLRIAASGEVVPADGLIGRLLAGRAESGREGVGDNLPPSETAARVPALTDGRRDPGGRRLPAREDERRADAVFAVVDLRDETDKAGLGRVLPASDLRGSARRGVGIGDGRIRLVREVLGESESGDAGGRENGSDSFLPRRAGIRPAASISISRRLP